MFVLAYTEELLAAQEGGLNATIKQTARKHGVAGFTDVANDLEKVSEQKSVVDEAKGMTLTEISRTVEEINDSINDRKVCGGRVGRGWGGVIRVQPSIHRSGRDSARASLSLTRCTSVPSVCAPPCTTLGLPSTGVPDRTPVPGPLPFSLQVRLAPHIKKLRLVRAQFAELEGEHGGVKQQYDAAMSQYEARVNSIESEVSPAAPPPPLSVMTRFPAAPAFFSLSRSTCG